MDMFSDCAQATEHSSVAIFETVNGDVVIHGVNHIDGPNFATKQIIFSPQAASVLGAMLCKWLLVAKARQYTKESAPQPTTNKVSKPSKNRKQS